MSDAKAKFFHFPLCALAYGGDHQSRVQAAIAYGTISAGLAFEQRLGGKQKALDWLDGEGIELPSNAGPHERAWGLGKGITGYCWQKCPNPCCAIYRDFEAFHDRFGKTPFVRIPGDVVLEWAHEVFEQRDFAILAAVYAVIGEKSYCRVRRDRVRAGSLGYSSAGDLFDKQGNLTSDGEKRLATRQDNTREPLTTDQVRYALDRLHTRKFFSRLNPKGPRGGNSRATWYSRNLDHQELAEKLLARIQRKSEAVTAQQAAEDFFRGKQPVLLKWGKRGDNAGSALIDSPENPQFVPGGVPGAIPRGVPTLIPAS